MPEHTALATHEAAHAVVGEALGLTLLHHEDSEVEDQVSNARIADGEAATDQLLDLLWPAVQAVAAAIEVGGGTLDAKGFHRVLDAAISRDQRAQAVEQIEFIRRPFNAA